jgi:hypothetical protein
MGIPSGCRNEVFRNSEPVFGGDVLNVSQGHRVSYRLGNTRLIRAKRSASREREVLLPYIDDKLHGAANR